MKYEPNPLGFFILGMIAGLAIAEFVIKVAGRNVTINVAELPTVIEGQAHGLPTESDTGRSRGDNSDREKPTS